MTSYCNRSGYQTIVVSALTKASSGSSSLLQNKSSSVIINKMLVCPACNHQLTLPSSADTSATSPATVTPQDSAPSSLHTTMPSSPLAFVTTSLSPPPQGPTSFTGVTSSGGVGKDASSLPSSQQHVSCHVRPSCHIAPSCHVSRTSCHETTACRVHALPPYICGCTVNRGSSQSSSLDPQQQGSTQGHLMGPMLDPSCQQQLLCDIGFPVPPSNRNSGSAAEHFHQQQQQTLLAESSRCFYDTSSNTSGAEGTAAPSVGFSHHINLDTSCMKSVNLGSCPTSPSTTMSQCNIWSTPNTQLHAMDQSTHPGCSNSQPCTVHPGSSDFTQRPPSLNHSMHCFQAKLAQPNCQNNFCLSTRPVFNRQSSCPSTPCLASLTCQCLQQQQPQHRNSSVSLDQDHCQYNTFPPREQQQPHHHHHHHQQQQQVSNPALQHQPQPFTQFQFQLPEVSTLGSHQQQQSGFCLTQQQDFLQNNGDNIVILNSTGGGGMIIERKPPSRTGSPELKFTLSLPFSSSPSSSGTASPSGVSSSTVSFDREKLMQTLASLPVLTTNASSVIVSQSSQVLNSAATTTRPSFIVSNHTSNNFAPQNFSKISFPHVSPTQSTSSSSSPSPLSFQQQQQGSSSPVSFQHNNDRLSYPADPNFNRSVSTDPSNSSSSDTRSNNNNNFITSINNFFMPNFSMPSCTAAVAATSASGEPVIGGGGGGPVPNVGIPNDWTSSDDSRVLRRARSELEECGWYYGGLTWREAGAVLAGSSEGSFLVRDSWSGRCLYALSLQTSRGPTSVRIEYENGKFRLESETGTREGVPQRSSVVALVQAYTQTSNPAHVWVDHSGQTVSAISVRRPLRKNPPSLQHLARLAHNANPGKVDMSDHMLPNLIRAFINSYPHTC